MSLLDDLRPTAQPVTQVAKAIQTHYAGCWFRSRLEARWAVFFDYMKIAWQYEPQGFWVGSDNWPVAYLPDFQLPGLDLWVEVKGTNDTMDWDTIGGATDGFARHLPMLTHKWVETGAAVLVLGNIPRLEHHQLAGHPLVLNRKGAEAHLAQFVAKDYIQLSNDTFGHYDVTTNQPFQWDTHVGELSVHGVVVQGWQTPVVQSAYLAARRARFEHGESGLPEIVQ